MALQVRKPSTEEDPDKIGRQLFADDTRSEAQHIHVVVFDTLPRREGIVAETRAHAVELVRGDARANTTPANQYSAISSAIRYHLSQRGGPVGVVITRLNVITTNVERLVASSDDFREDTFP